MTGIRDIDMPKVNAVHPDRKSSLAFSTFSPKGKYWSYALSEHGSDWVAIYSRRNDGGLSSTNQLSDVVRNVKFTLALLWSPDEAVGPSFIELRASR